MLNIGAAYAFGAAAAAAEAAVGAAAGLTANRTLAHKCKRLKTHIYTHCTHTHTGLKRHFHTQHIEGLLSARGLRCVLCVYVCVCA
jgi:hypothetical protein